MSYTRVTLFELTDLAHKHTLHADVAHVKIFQKSLHIVCSVGVTTPADTERSDGTVGSQEGESGIEF